ncbi:MAG TPA: MBL fold metallo-hydrolase [Micropepsaceae bacterium]|nr:MBL fold metallo-hydrolase [Micropepsaceae bacterium]
MRMLKGAIAGIAVVMSIAACTEQKTGIEAAADAMGATTLNSIEYSGSGSLFGFGQAFVPGERWPRFEQRSYVASINYQTPAMRLNSVRSQGEHPPRGGAAQPVAADQRAIQVVSGKSAWTEGGAEPVATPNAVGDRLRALWATPHGVIKAALANGGTLDGKVISLNVEGRAVKATLNDQNLVEKVAFLSTNEVVGDYPIEITYSDYADYGGVKFPTHIVQTEDGFPTLDIKVSEVKPNAAVAIDVPGGVTQAIPPPQTPEVKMDKLADGVWFLYAAGVGSWAVEFKDYIVVVEGPASEARSLAVNDAIRKAVPEKPIKYVVNTHAHYDHAGGLRTYPAQGITVITQEMNKPFFENVWARPRTLAPDTLSKSPMPLMFETVDDKKVLSDEARTLEIYRLKDSRHNAANLMVFLPKEGLLYYGDGYNPPPGPDPRDPARTPEYGIDLYRNVLLRNLNVTRIAPAHTARAVPYDNLKKAIGVLPVDAE